MSQPLGVCVTWSPAELRVAGLISEVPSLTLACPPATRPGSWSPVAVLGGWHCSLGEGLISVCGDSSEAVTGMPVGWCKQRARCQG